MILRYINFRYLSVCLSVIGRYDLVLSDFAYVRPQFLELSLLGHWAMRFLHHVQLLATLGSSSGKFTSLQGPLSVLLARYSVVVQARRLSPCSAKLTKCQTKQMPRRS